MAASCPLFVEAGKAEPSGLSLAANRSMLTLRMEFVSSKPREAAHQVGRPAVGQHSPFCVPGYPPVFPLFLRRSRHGGPAPGSSPRLPHRGPPRRISRSRDLPIRIDSWHVSSLRISAMLRASDIYQEVISTRRSLPQNQPANRQP